MDGEAPKPTIFNNVELPAYGDPECPDCHGKGFVGVQHPNHSNSVTPCETCCKHERKTKAKDWCRDCGKSLLFSSQISVVGTDKQTS